MNERKAKPSFGLKCYFKTICQKIGNGVFKDAERID